MLSISSAVFFTLLTGTVLVLYFYLKHIFTYWSRHGIWQFPTIIPFGHAWPLIWERKHMSDFFFDYYKQLKAKNRSCAGLYLLGKPMLLVIDPLLIQHVLATDFSHFRDRGVWCNEKVDPLSANIFSLPSGRWKPIRHKLSPFFTLNKMKLLFPTIEACGPNLVEMTSKYAEKDEPVNMKSLIWRFSCLILGSCVFGFDCNTMEDENDIVVQVGRDIFEPGPLQAMKKSFSFVSPEILKFLRMSSNSKFVTDFFFKLTKETIEYREKHNVRRNDLMQILVDSREKNANALEDSDGLTMNEIAAQCWVFFAGGFESAGSLVTYCLYELTQNMDIQDKVREEINEALAAHDGKFTFEAMSKMKYLEAALKETLRKHPPFAFLNRECTKDYTFPNSNVTVRKGDAVVISAMGLQRDADIYPEPEKFDPDRFTEGSTKINPFTYLPFGEGPRICIGSRLGLLQGKFTIAVLLNYFQFTFNNKTKTPFELAKNTIATTVDGDIWLNAKKL